MHRTHPPSRSSSARIGNAWCTDVIYSAVWFTSTSELLNAFTHPARYAHRAGIEGTIARATRRSDVHHARYRGLAKTHLQHLLTALALNLVRLDAWLSGIPPGGSWASRLARLRPALSPV
jgi:hypothetical protein